MFWVLLAMMLFTFVVGQILAPRPRGAGVANINAVTPPTAQKGIPVPVVFGTCKIAPNVVWYGNVHADPQTTITGNRTLLNPFATNHSTVTGYRYGCDLTGVLCHGPIDELLDIMFQDTSILRYTTANTNYVMGPSGVPVLTAPFLPAFPHTLPAGNNPDTYTINAPDLFGGSSQDGGVQAKIDFFFGKLTQNASAAFAAKLGAPVSNYKGICYFVAYDGTYGTSPYLKNFYAIVRRCPWTVSALQSTSNINGSANAADVIFEIMTDTRWGLGLPAAGFDMASFAAAALTLKTEGMGLDFVMNAQDQAESTIGEILRHVDGAVFTHPQSGLVTFKLARADYNVATIPHLNTSNATKFTNYKRSTWPETLNQVTVTYLHRGDSPYYDFTDDTVMAQNLASAQAMQEIAAVTYAYSYFSNAATALACAFRTLRVVSVPLASGTITVNRTLFNLTVGSVLVLDWEPLGITGMVMRVLGLNYGTLESNQVELQLIEDVFNTAPIVFTAPVSTAWVAPSLVPVAPTRVVAIPAPYYLTRADQFVGMNMVVRANGAGISWDGYYNNVPTAPDAPVTGVKYTDGAPFCPAGLLTAIYPWNTAYQDEVGFFVSNLYDLDKLIGTTPAGLTRGDLLAWIGDADGGEIIAWRDIVPQTNGTYLIVGVLRGQFDTVPVDHAAGETVYFFYPSGYQAYFPGQDTSTTPPLASAQTLSSSGYKLWAAIKGIVSSVGPDVPTAVIKIPATNTPSIDPKRAVMPLPVGDTKLNTVRNNVINPVSLLPDSNTVAWLHRNRLLQTSTLPHDYPDVTIEATETYEVDVVHVSRTTGANVFGLLRTFSGATSPITYTNQQFEADITAANGGASVGALDTRRTGGGIRFLVRSVRGGLKSYDLAVPGFTRKQITGKPIIPSLQFTNIYVAPIVSSSGTQMDMSYLQAWYSADESTNVLTGTRLDTWKDKSGNTRDLTRSGGTPTKNPAQINTLPSIDLGGADFFSNLSIQLEGSMTFFAVMKYSNIGAYHNFFDTLGTGAPTVILWIDGSGLMEPNAESSSANKPSTAGVWAVIVIHNTQATSKTGYKVRVNGVQVASDNGGFTAFATIPGAIGTPAAFAATMFNRSGANGLHAQVAEFGFIGRSRDGAELPLEAYLMDKYGFIPAMDTVSLGAWYAADYTAITGGKILGWTDRSGHGRDLTSALSNTVPVAGGLNGRQYANFTAAGDYLSNLTLPLEGGMTFFAVFKVTSSSANQCLFDPVSGSLPNCQIFWDQPTNRWQADGSLAGTSPVAGTFITMVVHCYNTGSNAQMKVRVNGVQISSAAMTTAGVPMPGAPGTPVSAVLSLFNRATGLLNFTSQIAEFGFYTISKDGSEAALESYLRGKYKTW